MRDRPATGARAAQLVGQVIPSRSADGPPGTLFRAPPHVLRASTGGPGTHPVTSSRRSRAISLVRNGDSVALGGHLAPSMAPPREIVRQGKRDLHVLG
jgi:hypothetical protein